MRTCTPPAASTRAAKPSRLGRVVVAAGQDHLGTRGAQAHQRVVQQGHRVDGGQRPVVDIAGHQHDVDPLGRHDLDQVVQEASLGIVQPDPVEGPPQVPVRGVDQPHVSESTSAAATLPRTSDGEARASLRQDGAASTGGRGLR